MYIIDAHIHCGTDHPELLSFMDQQNVKMLNIGTCGGRDPGWRQSAETYRRLTTAHPTRFAWVTSFLMPPEKPEPDYADKVIAGLDQDFTNGAVGVKMWRSVGMNLKWADGRYMMIDEPVFEPIFRYMEHVGPTLHLHIGEPLECWRPLDPNGAHYMFYSGRPSAHAYGKPIPSHEAIIAARDRVVARHPKLRVTGAHMGSLEHDVRELAKRFDQYPNFAVDTSGRMYDLTLQDQQVVRQFFIDYQDRLMFGTDMGHSDSKMKTADGRKEVMDQCQELYGRATKYFTTNEMVRINARIVQGLNLPAEVVDKLFHRNAQKWYPGV